ncbi:MAG: hypothetical protein AAGG08_14055 [Actinomycetota bacterium]
MERNLSWYRWNQVVAGALFWAATTFLYLIARFGLSTALQAQVVYYVAVVVLEVPSGWLSDRFGRVLTLRIVAVAWSAAYGLFLIEPGFAGIAAAQVLLAAGYAFLSGSDTTFHLETLESLGRATEFHDREAGIRRLLLWSGAVSALIGGALGVVDLRLPFVASLLAAVLQLAIALRLVEPPVVGTEVNRDTDRLVAVVRHVKTPLLGWITAFVAVTVVSTHLAADLSAPYLTAVLDADPASPGAAALLNGAVAAVVAAVAAMSLHVVVPLARRLGLASTLLSLALVPVAILIAMTTVTSIWLIPLMTLRRLPSAAASVFAPPVVAGFIGSPGRATYLSLASFAGRMSYAAVLLVVSLIDDDDLGGTLTVAAVVAGGSWLVIAVLARTVRPWPSALDHGHAHEHKPIRHEHVHVHHDVHHDHQHATGRVPPQAHQHLHDHDATTHTHSHLRDAHHGHDHSERERRHEPD